MKILKLVSTLVFSIFLIGCSSNDATNAISVSNNDELLTALKDVTPGTTILMEDGVYSDIEIHIQAEGTENAPISLKAKNPGNVFIEGVSDLKLGGSFINVDGLYFRNGYTPSNAVIDFKITKELVATNCTVSNVVIKDFNQMKRDLKDHWVEFWGRHNTLKNSYLAGKINEGPTVRVEIKGRRNIENHHKIVNNHFGPRPRKGGPKAETIQLGDSFSSMSPSNTLVANNFFDECNGEVEIISSKTNYNEFRNNVFYKSEGSLVTRHGNYCTIDGNYFLGDADNVNVGGIRLINTGHTVTNNYFYNLKGASFRSPLAVMNGIPKSPLNRYNQVTDVIVAYNTYVNCLSPWQFGVGTNISQSEVLPLSEIRSARPIRTTVANNVIYNTTGDASPIVEHDKADGVLFKSNVINNQGVAFPEREGLTASNFELNQINDFVFLPTGTESVEPFIGFGFDAFNKDLFNFDRSKENHIGATVKSQTELELDLLDPTKYGPSWFDATEKALAGTSIAVSSSEELISAIEKANSGDTIELAAGTYAISESLKVNQTITVKGTEGVTISYEGAPNSALFELHPYGLLTINDVKLEGSKTQMAFASLKEDMYNHFGLTTKNIEVSNFNYVLKVYKQAYAEELTFKNSTFANCANGIELSEETNDKGDYNTEFLTVANCTFDGIKSNVIDYYRGGYDESTIGGNLILKNSTFKNCGAKEPTRILINTRGIVNVAIEENTFINNQTKLVALLWGAKNNSHKDNTLKNSGIIKTEENLKLKLVY